MFRGFKEALDGWVQGESYHAFDEPGDFDHRFRLLQQLGSLKIPRLIIVRNYDARFAQVSATLRDRGRCVQALLQPVREAAPAIDRDTRLAQASVCVGLGTLPSPRQFPLMERPESAYLADLTMRFRCGPSGRATDSET
jgi:hypothetical protein